MKLISTFRWGSRLRTLIGLLATALPALAAPNYLEIRNGYFWDPGADAYFLARGVAYQTWNIPVGANQSFDQIDYDLREFKKLHANSVRCEFTWGNVHTGENTYDWSKADFLVQEAEKLGLRLFVLIGYQYPPAWVPTALHNVNELYTTSNVPTEVNANVLSDVINYEHPDARRIYTNYIAAVTARYRNSPAIGAWIVGNEYAYYDLWETNSVHRFIGYDPLSQASFRRYLQTIYRSDIAALDANWQTNYTDFSQIEMPRPYPPDRVFPGYHDLLQWRKQSIGNYVAAGAVAALQNDPHHLRTYSMVGGIFANIDANHPCEDAVAIVGQCAAAGAPLHFWSVNNYPWPAMGSELRSVDLGIAKYQMLLGLPVMVSETGYTSTETIWNPEPCGLRQSQALPSTLWESVICGAIGVHFFHWSDRTEYGPATAPHYREYGFGIVQETRNPKPAGATNREPVYDAVARTFRQMEGVRLDALLGGSRNPLPDIQLLWSTNSDLVWPRANQENTMLWGALRRLGYQPGILNDAQFDRGDYTNAPALVLSRAYQLSPGQLDILAKRVIPAGIHVHATADLPGQYDAYHRPNANWAATMAAVFGVGVTGASPAFEGSVFANDSNPLALQGVANLGDITPSYRTDFATWRFWHGVKPLTARTIITDSGLDGHHPGTPALLVSNPAGGAGKGALFTFAGGDTTATTDANKAGLYVTRYDLLRAVYRSTFGIHPKIDITGPGAKYVIPDYRLCRDGSVLLSVMNEITNAVSIVISAPELLAGRKVENLLIGGVLSDSSSGEVALTLPPDGYALLYAYATEGQTDHSLVQPSPNKLWFNNAPAFVWPQPAPYSLDLGFDLRTDGLGLVVALEQVVPHLRTFARSAPVAVTGKGRISMPLELPDADANDPQYLPSRVGAEYRLHASLEKDGVVVSDTALPVQVGWGIRPVAPWPYPVVPGRSYPIGIQWEDLPSYLPGDVTPLDRARLWDSAQSTVQRYSVVLELRSQGNVVASASTLTRQSTGTNLFQVAVPASAPGPFTWTARLETAPNVASHDVEEGFEGYVRGAMWPGNMNAWYTPPWRTYQYPKELLQPGQQLWLNEGVQLNGSEGSQSAFQVVTNVAGLPYAGLGMAYEFPTTWALPDDAAGLAQYTFSFDFREASGAACNLELQLKDANGRFIAYPSPNQPPFAYAATNTWKTLSAKIAQFDLGPGQEGFDPHHIQALVVNVQMLKPAVMYVASFDNIRFVGPEVNLGGGTVAASYSSANDGAGTLSVTDDGTAVIISWTSHGVLQTAPESAGPWSDLSLLHSPVRVVPSEQQRFYQLRAP